MNLKKLRELATKAAVTDHNESEGWYSAEYLANEGMFYMKNARHAEACTPQTIIALLDLVACQHDALMQFDSREMLPGEWDTATEMYDKFNQE